jgi:hypothetical protein
MKMPRTNSMSPKRNWLFMFLLLLALIVVGCDASNEEVVSNQEKQDKENKIVSEFAAKHGAIFDWNKKLLDEQNSPLGNFYTADLQKAVMDTKEKPVVLILGVEDIYKDKDKIFVQFGPPFLDRASPEGTYYDFECAEILVNKIKNIKNSKSSLFGPKFLVIATLKSVYKLKYGVTAHPAGYNEEAELEVGVADSYAISGQCVDLMPLENN